MSHVVEANANTLSVTVRVSVVIVRVYMKGKNIKMGSVCSHNLGIMYIRSSIRK